MSANLVVDLGNTCLSQSTINGNVFGSSVGSWTSGLQTPLSGAIIGNGINLNNADTLCNLQITGCPTVTSGQLRIQVQCADNDVSGQYTDPTSGLAQFPGVFQSGGIVWLNSGGLGTGTVGAGVSGQFIQSGFNVFTGFQRPVPGTFARANVLSGDSYLGDFDVAFVSQNRTTGSGGGFTFSPGSGVVSV